MKMNIHLKKQLIMRVCALLIATVSIGLIFNLINPSGLPLRKVVSNSVVEKDISAHSSSVYDHNINSVSVIKAEQKFTEKTSEFSNMRFMGIQWKKASKLIEENKAVFIDLRSERDYETKHFPGTVSLPFRALKESMINFTEKYNTDTPLLIGCVTPGCTFALKTRSELLQANYKDVKVTYGMNKEWGVDSLFSISSAIITDGQNISKNYNNKTIRASVIPVNGREFMKNSANYNLNQLSWEEVKPLLEQEAIVLADGRSRQAFEAGHIPGAVSLPLATLNEEIGSFKNKFPTDTTIIVYCSNIRCGIAQKLSYVLMNYHGYSDVHVMPGGYLEWRQAEL
jgi:rhodanese-related sulfurtransferase